MLKDLLVVVNHYDGCLIENIKKYLIQGIRHISRILWSDYLITRLATLCEEFEKMKKGIYIEY